MAQALTQVMFQAKMQPGYITCQLYAETGNPQSLFYLEQWATREDLETQLESQRFGMLLGIMETASALPHLEIHTISDQRGLEYVEAIRLRSGTNAVESRLPVPG